MIIKEGIITIEITKEEMELFEKASKIIETLNRKIENFENVGQEWNLVNSEEDIATICDLATYIHATF